MPQANIHFDNPLGHPDHAKHPPVVEPTDDGDNTPTAPDAVAPNVFLHEELGTERRSLHFLVFVLLSMAMLVYALVIAAAMLYILYVAMESIVFVLALQSTFLVGAVVWGIHAACVASEPALNAYSFMLLMAVVMQFSLVMVVVVRGDEMLLFFESSALAAQNQLCADLGFAKNANATVLNNSTANVEDAGSQLCACNDGASQCVMAYIEREYGLRPDQYTWAQLIVTLLQIVLAKLAWGLIRDLDYVADQRRKKQAGGPPTGILRGTIMSGQNLLDTRSKRGRDPMCVLELLTPDTAVKQHRVQKVETQPRVDTLAPQWDQDFDQLVAYKGSREMKISLLDMSKRNKPVPMGSTLLTLDSQYIQRAGGLLEEMVGHNTIQVDLSFTEQVKKSAKKATQQSVAAGTVSLSLLYLPVGGSVEKVAKSVTKSWYFEATVLLMVGLSMAILAFQSPTVPPSDALRGTLSLLEIFVATHMTMELTLELFADFVNGSLKTELRNPWKLLALYVCLCNWISIFQPVQLLGQPEGQPEGQGWAKLFSVSRIFRVVRPIRTLRMIRHIEIVTRVISSQMSTLLGVCVLVLFLLLLYSLIGMSCFSGAIHYTCMDTALVRRAVSGTADTVVSADWPRGCAGDCDTYLPQTLIERGILRGVEPVQSDGALVSCPQSLQCAQDAPTVLPANTSIVRCIRLGTGECVSEGFNNYTASSHEMEACESLVVPSQVGNDEFGFQGFDNILRAGVTMYVQMTGDGGMHSMPQALYAAGSGSEQAAWFIFFTASVCLNLLALNLFLAVCCGAYSNVSGELSELDAMLTEQQRERGKAMQLDETPEEKQHREAEEAERALSVDDRVEALDWNGTASRLPGCRNYCKQIVRSHPFDVSISVVILLNTLAMALNHHGIDQDRARVLAIVESVFLGMFFLELVLKISGLGLKLYFMYPSNKFDFFVMFVCLSGYLAMMFEDDLVAAFGLEHAEGGAGMQALRAVRLLRALQLTRLLHKQRAFRVVLKTIFSAWKPICLHSIFCCFSVCMFAVIGMHVLGGSLGCRVSFEESPGGVCPEGERVALYKCHGCRKALVDDYPYENYETFMKAVLAVFELTVGEEWSFVMYWYMAHAGDDSSLATAIVQAFFVAQYLWMNCILFSLFTAMLLENFNIKDEDKMPIQKRLWEHKKRKELKIWRSGKDSLLMKTLNAEKQKGVAQHEETMKEKLQHSAAVADLNDSANKSLYVFTLNHPLRLRCAAIQGHPAFRNGILGLIVLSCVSLAIEGPKQGYVMQHFGVFFESLNAIVLVVFVFEAFLKIITHGFWFTSGPSKPYLKTNKNKVDFFVIVICIIAYLPIVGELLQGGWAKALRLVRVMTPLISLTKNPQILLVVISFLRALPDTLVVVLPLFLMAMVFGIIGQQWFGGVLGGCHSSCTVMPSRCTTTLALQEDSRSALIDSDLAGIGTLESCIAVGGTWESPLFNFDTSLSAVSLLFVAITDGVHGHMVDSTEAVPAGSSTLFWIAFHVVFTCFFLNLFIGVLSASFSKSKGTATQTARQMQWSAVAQNVASFQPVVTVVEGSKPVAKATCCTRPQPLWVYKCRLLCYKAATNPILENCWRLAIVVNTLTLATDQFPSSAAHHELVNYVNLVCLSILTVEVVIKLTGYGLTTYFGSGWLVSDFLLVVIAWALRLGSVRSGLETLRIVRIFRLVALASRLPTLVALISSLVSCVKTSLALIAICCIIIYFYCIVGMNLFGSLDIDPERGHLNDLNNFSNFLTSAAVLVQISFGQEISGFIEDLNEMGVNFWLAFVYFASYYMVMLWVCVNLLLVTILETFAAETADTDTDGVRPKDFQSFSQCWAALTIGVHMIPYCEKKESFLSKMVHNAAHPMKAVREAVASDDEGHDDDFVPEDGDLHQQGNLTVTVERVTGIQSDVIRPYCKVQLRGVDKQEFWTPEAETVDGTAVFPDTVAELSAGATPAGCTASMNINEHHDWLHFAVHDNYQFTGEILGEIKFDRRELETMKETTTKQFQLQRRADASPICRDGAYAQDHWARFETDDSYLHEIVDELETLDEVDDDNSSTMPAVLSSSDATSAQRLLMLQSAMLSAQALKAAQSTKDTGAVQATNAQPASSEPDVQHMTSEEKKAYKRAEKARKKSEKRRKKAEEKAKKAELKRAKKEAKRRRKAGLPEKEEGQEEDGVPPSTDEILARKWVDSGITLQVTFKFERYDLCTPRMGFLADFTVSYAHKEANCGVEGWLECSEGGGPFKRRFVYLQDNASAAQAVHGGVIKLITNADNGNSLAHLASANRLEISSLQAESIMNIFSDHLYRSGDDPHRKQAKNVSQIGCEFQIGVDLRNENTFVEKCVARISGKIVGAENLTNVASGKGETADPYCVLTLISTGMLAENAGKGRQVQRTSSVADDLNPTWNCKFAMDATVTTTTMLIEVFHDRLGRDPLIGTAELKLASGDFAGPSCVWSSSAFVSDGDTSTVDFASNGRRQVKVRLTPDKRRSKKNMVVPDTVNSGDDDSSAQPSTDVDGAGTVTIELLYAPTCSKNDVQSLVKLSNDIDRQYGTTTGENKKEDAAKLAELQGSQLAVAAPKRVDFRFRALSPANQLAWVTAIRWLTLGCPEAARPKPVPHASLVRSELARASDNISLIDLPVSRLTRLVHGLYRRQAVGGHMPTRRWITYAVFSIELHALANTKAAMKNKDTRRTTANGVYLADIRGLPFHRTLERLVLLHLGKEKCLSYQQHAAEYEREVNSVSLHIIKTVLQWWVNRKRLGKPQGGKQFPILPIWSYNEALYLRASEAVCVARIRSLRVLFAEVAKRKPVDYSVEGAERLRGTKKRTARKLRGNRAGKDREQTEGVLVDAERIEAVFSDLDSSDSGELNEQQVRAGLRMLIGQLIPDELESKMVEMIDIDRSGIVSLPQFIEGLNMIAQEALDQQENEVAEDGEEGFGSDLEDLDTDMKSLQRKYGKDEDYQ